MESIRIKIALKVKIAVLTALIFFTNSRAEEMNKNESLVSDNDFLICSGIVKDSETKQPVIFANVFIEGTSIGTVTNSDGEFILKVPLKMREKNIGVSFIGYKKTEFSIESIKGPNSVLHIEPDPVPIEEVIIKTTDPVLLLRKALNMKKENYSTDPVMLTSFYREIIQQNRSYVSVSEAVLDIYKASYTGMEGDRVKIHKGRRSRDVKRMDTVLFKYQGGPSTMMMLDLMKSSNLVLDEEMFKYYIFKMDGMINKDNKKLYVVDFKQRKPMDIPLYDGKIYVSEEDHAIVAMEFRISELGMSDAAASLVKKKPFGMKVTPISANYFVSYREMEDKWYLNHVQAEVKFDCKWKKKLFKSKYVTLSEMAITDMDSENVTKFKYSEAVRLSDILSDQVSDFNDDDFWGEYNIIKPEESIESAIEKINKKLIRRQK